MNTLTPSADVAPSSSAADRQDGRILIVDDDPGVRMILQRYLERRGHQVHAAADAAEAMQIFADNSFELVVTDLRMPGPSGLDLLREIQACAPETRRMLMSANADVPAAAQAIEQGIDFLRTKPFARCREADRAQRARKRLEARLEAHETDSGTWLRRAAHALTEAVEAKDRYTAGHARRVTAYALTIAEHLGGIDLLAFRLAGELHDVGKIGVPDQVLNKPGRLTPEEFGQIEEHPVIGAGIVKPLVDDLLVLSVVLWHHEHWDGKGYPEQLAGDTVPLPARVLAVADTLDAMTSSRAYRAGLPWEAAVAEIRRCAGTQFDPDVVAAFEQVLPTIEAQHRDFVPRDRASARQPAA